MLFSVNEIILASESENKANVSKAFILSHKN